MTTPVVIMTTNNTDTITTTLPSKKNEEYPIHRKRLQRQPFCLFKCIHGCDDGYCDHNNGDDDDVNNDSLIHSKWLYFVNIIIESNLEKIFLIGEINGTEREDEIAFSIIVKMLRLMYHKYFPFDYMMSKMSFSLTSGYDCSILFYKEGLNGIGNNYSGQLGGINKSSTDEWVDINLNRMEISSLSTIITVACGKKHTLILTSKGNLYGCGSNDYCQLGLKKFYRRSYKHTLTQITLNTLQNGDKYGKIINVVCGDLYSMILTTNGLFACGNNQCGQLGLGNVIASKRVSKQLLFTRVDIDESLKHNGGDSDKIFIISCGRNHTIMVSMKGYLYGCGSNLKGQLGISVNKYKKGVYGEILDNEGRHYFKPTLIGRNESIIAVVCGTEHSIMLTKCGLLCSTGSNSFGQLGLGFIGNSFIDRFVYVHPYYKPENYENDKKEEEKEEEKEDITITYIACGDNHSWLLTSKNELYGCGSNQFTQLGFENKNDYKIFTKVTPKDFQKDEVIVSITNGSRHTSIVTNLSQIVYCGNDTYKEFKNNII